MMIPANREQRGWPALWGNLFGSEWIAKTDGTTPAVNVRETDDRYRVEVAAPGATREDFKIRIEENDRLMVTLDKQSERRSEGEGAEQGRYLRREFSYSHFRQNLILPDDIDTERIEAKVENGVLTIDLPKKSAEELKPAVKEIEVR